MTKPITYSPLPDPGGLTPEEWAAEVRLMQSRGWLQDPNNLDWPEDTNHPHNISRRQKEGACLKCCWRGRCKREGRCLHLIHLAIRENRHNIWPDTWKARVERADLNETAPFVPAELLPKLRRLST